MATSAEMQQVERPVGASPDPRRRRAPRQHRGGDLADGMFGLSLMAGSANVIMQLARPGVGYGVLESTVDSGRADLHPFKRARTTIGYLAVVALGNEVEQRAFRKAVDGSHRQVRSGTDSPVKYNAFDPELQLWVAACLYKGSVDLYRMFYGEMDDDEAERHYQEAKAFGTTLQMRPEMWPPNRDAFDTYWQEQLDTNIGIDGPVQKYLYGIAAVRMRGVTLPGPLHKLVEAPMLFITTGFLPQRFRDEMRLPWDAAKQRQFDAMIAALRMVNNLTPGPLRRFPFNALMWDMRWRMRTGRPLV
ncbi:oxygenase MpaB family protein [[Mycobacterium] nativiensis]|uniref:Oxygenase MpaB family protein n=1 Tax=[Mycobacterium] nativiensis TaxID=2855503 RepID=A0ABU5XX29_9MYCO|nr:oxygenase MpaB family protein [Mycolicibacter sp. MYC340]MEB3032347.1 oxygenase MpaB family protein [Mycolicibacter sp. MYC340]